MPKKHEEVNHTRKKTKAKFSTQIFLIVNILHMRNTSGSFVLYFERSEFLIATSKNKKTDRLPVCPDVRLILVLVLGRQIVYGQNTVYLCLSKYIPGSFLKHTAVQASCGEKHSTEWRLPTWCPHRRSPLVPSRTDSSNLHVI